MKYQPPVGNVETSPIQGARKALGEDGVVAPWMQGAFNHAAFFFRPPDELMLDALTRPDFYHRLMSYYQARNKQIARQCLEAGADVMSYGANIASGKMVSAAFFGEFIAPYERDLIESIQSNGGRVLFHNCGYARHLLSEYRELGMRAYESLTPPPYGDTPLAEAVDILGGVCTLSGNIDQIDFLQRADPSEIRERVREAIDMVRGRAAFILATTDYLHEDTPHANIQAFADAGREFGGTE
jgi:uroporphyrinogen decarboxylase